MRLGSRHQRLVVVLAVLVGVAGLWLAEAAVHADRQGAASFKRGISIGHWLAKMNGGRAYGAPWFGREDIVWIAQQGFDHIRYPVDGRLWRRADGTLDESRIAPFLQALAWTREQGLSAVLDMHFLPGGTYNANDQDLAVFTDPAARAVAAKFWGDVAQRLVAEGPWLRFELINEPFAPDPAQLTALNTAILSAIRAHDRQRVVYITSNLAGSFDTLDAVVFPADPNVALLLHYDEPMIFTHQRASWKRLPATMPLVEFPGTVPDLKSLVPPDHFAARVSGTELTVAGVGRDFARVNSWMRTHAPGREVYIGGFGTYEAAPAQSRKTYISTVRAAAEREGFGWAIWDYRSSFAVRQADGRPTSALEGLFPR